MERRERSLERPPASQPSRRGGLPENPAQGRRVAAANAAPPPPVPALPNMRSNSSLSATEAVPPMSSGQVIALAREMRQKALAENREQAAEASGVGGADLKAGVTIDLSRKHIQKLPEEVIDIIKDDLERLALSHNRLSSFPAKLAECTSLRYLNVRDNDIREFPLPLCDLKSLEILDLGRNKLQVLPPEIVRLTSLKVFAVQKNRIEELPLCLADMASLQVLKLDGNRIRFPPPEVLQVQASSPSNESMPKESEVTEVTMTAHVKKFLKQQTMNMNGRTDNDAGGDESSEGTETPRMPMRRVTSGRFPVRVPGSDVTDMRPPANSRPPPIPSRSHFRGLSQQNTAIRRPGVLPLTSGNANERVRSNSETTFRTDRPGDRSRRMGIVSRKTQELATLDEMQANNRFSHYRGLSHGSAMQGTPAGQNPGSPSEPHLQRPVYVRRLSVLPERRRESKYADPIVEAAKGILYSVFQIHPMIQMLMSLTSEGEARHSSLEIVFYNTNVHVEELEQEVQKHDPLTADDDDIGQRETENVQRACITLVNAYLHVCSLLADNVDLFVDNGDPRYIRTLLMLLYNSIMELRITALSGQEEDGHRRRASRAAIGDTIRPLHSRESSATPTTERSDMYGRPPRGYFVHNPSNLRVATDVPISQVNGLGGRSATITLATPRSGESFASGSSRGGNTADFTEEDRIFERIFLSLQRSSEAVIRTLPSFNGQLTSSFRAAMAQRAPERVVVAWKDLIAKCNTALHQTELLKSRLSSIKLKEPGIRAQGPFWQLCNTFIDAWAEFAHQVRDSMRLVPLPPDTRPRLRPIQQCMKETRDLILASPWSYFTRQAGLGGPGPGNGGGGVPNGPASSFNPPPAAAGGAVQMPMTPQSAALGPAVQATVPSTPQSASFAAAFNGNVFERADALISMGGLSMSRTGTTTSSMSNASATSLGSVGGSSGGGTLSSTHEGTITPASSMMLSPLPPRLNGGGSKATF